MNDFNTDEFINYLRVEKRMSEHTLKAYQTDLSQFINYCDEKLELHHWHEIESADIRTWVLTLMEEGISNTSIHRKVSVLKSLYKYFIKTNKTEKNPALEVPLPKKGKRLPQFINEEAMENLFSKELFPETFEGMRDRVLIELFYATGMRLSELLPLKHCDFDFYNQTVTVLGKRNKVRVIPLTSEVLQLLQDYEDFLKKELHANEISFIFVSRKMKKLSTKSVYNIVKKYLDMITTIDQRSPHTLRHTFATHLLNNGADINAIKEILGHASLAATQIYTHNSLEKLKSMYNQAHPRA